MLGSDILFSRDVPSFQLRNGLLSTECCILYCGFLSPADSSMSMDTAFRQKVAHVLGLGNVNM